MNFIRTKAKPHLFYLPRLHNDGTEKKLAETGTVLEGAWCGERCGERRERGVGRGVGRERGVGRGVRRERGVGRGDGGWEEIVVGCSMVT